MSRAVPALLLSLLLALAGCERILDDPAEDVPAVPPETVEAVVAGAEARLEAAWEEAGPRFYELLPAIKEAAAVEAGFEGWEHLARRLARTDPSLPARVSRRITARMRSLLGE